MGVAQPTMNTSSTIHSGLLVTDNGDALDVDLELIGGRTLRICVAGDELGTWPIGDCSIESDPDKAGSFRLWVDGDETVFTPENPSGFAAFAGLISGGAWATTDDDLPGQSAAIDGEGAESAEVEEDSDSVTADAEVIAAVEEPLLEGDFSADLDEEATLRKRLVSRSGERLSSSIGAMADRRGDDGDFEIGPNTVADEVLERMRTLRDRRSTRAVTPARLKTIGIVAGVLLVLGFFGLLAPRVIDFVLSYEGGPELPPSLIVAETRDEVPVVSPLEGSTIFDLPAHEFVARWDAAGGPINEVLEIRRLPALGPFDNGFTPFLRLVGVVLSNGAIDEISLVLDPSGPAEYDRIGLQALGVAIATVDPDISPEGRATLLRQLGLDVQAPQLDGVNGRTESGGIVYALVYDPDTNLLTFTIAPAS